MADKIIHINALGLVCPEPLTLLRCAVRSAADSQIIEIESDDPVSLRDIPAFCSFMQHDLVQLPDFLENHTFIIRKKSD